MNKSNSNLCQNVTIHKNFWLSVHQKRTRKKNNCPWDLTQGLLSRITNPQRFRESLLLIQAIVEGYIQTLPDLDDSCKCIFQCKQKVCYSFICFIFYLFLSQAFVDVFCALHCGLCSCCLKKMWYTALWKVDCRPWLVLASVVWCKKDHFKYSQENGITHKSIPLPKKEQEIRWVNLWSERWANLLYCCMISNPFPFPAVKELSEVHPLRIPSLCSPHNNYFSVLPFKTKRISSLKIKKEGKIFPPKLI